MNDKYEGCLKILHSKQTDGCSLQTDKCVKQQDISLRDEWTKETY